MFVRRHASGVVFLAGLLATEGLWAQRYRPAATTEVLAGQTLHIRLRQTISSYGSKVDTPISAVLIQPVELDGHIVLPLNTELRGMIARVRRIGIGLSHETALIDLRFDTLTIPGGQPQPLAGRVSAVDNSRETVDDKGVIHGIRATASTSKVISGLAISAASLDPMSQMFAASASLSAFRIPESAIILPVGTELTYKFETPITVERQFPGPEPFVRSEDQERQLSDFIRPLPFRTETAHPVTPSDLITLLYVGSQDSINRAFDAAGWVPADALSTHSKYGVMRSIIENQGYKEGPVSTLLLDGATPVAVYSKTLDTFFARHHLRVYAQLGTFDGQPVFSSTATHDSGIGVNKSAKSLIHLIDEHIDEERGKVIDDLLLTGCVDGVSYIERPWVPADAKNATGDTLRTDGRLAVLRMNDRANPHRADAPIRPSQASRARRLCSSDSSATRCSTFATTFFGATSRTRATPASKWSMGCVTSRRARTMPARRCCMWAGSSMKSYRARIWECPRADPKIRVQLRFPFNRRTHPAPTIPIFPSVSVEATRVLRVHLTTSRTSSSWSMCRRRLATPIT